MDMLTGHVLDLVSDDATEMPKGLVPGLSKVWLKFAEDRPRHYALMFSLGFNDPKRSALGAKRRNNLRLFLRSVVRREVGFEMPTAEADMIFAQIHGAAMLIATGDTKTPSKVLATAIERQLAAMKKPGRAD